MKPFQIILLAAFGIFALIGLIVFAGGGSTSSSARLGDVVIWGTLPREDVRSALTDIRQNTEEDFGGVSYIEVPLSDFHRAYTEALAAGRGPDMILIPHELLLAELETLSPISFDTFRLRDFEEQFIDGANIVVRAEGYYGIPIGIDPLVMYYNRAMFNAARISQAPRFWEQFIGLTPSLVDLGPGFTLERSFVALGAYTNIRHAREILSNLFFQVGSPIKDAAGKYVLDQKGESGVAPTESALRFYTGFANPNTSAYSWNKGQPEDRQEFLGNDLAVYFAPASEGETLVAANPNISIGSAPFPQLEGTVPVVYGSVYMLAVPRASSNIIGAKTAALRFIGRDTARVFAEATDITPVLRNLLNERQTDPLKDLAYEQALIAKGWFSPHPVTVDAAFSAMVDGVVSGRLKPREALQEAMRILQ